MVALSGLQRLDCYRLPAQFSLGRPRWLLLLWFCWGSPLLANRWLPGSLWRCWLLRLFGARIGAGVVSNPAYASNTPGGLPSVPIAGWVRPSGSTTSRRCAWAGGCVCPRGSISAPAITTTAAPTLPCRPARSASAPRPGWRPVPCWHPVAASVVGPWSDWPRWCAVPLTLVWWSVATRPGRWAAGSRVRRSGCRAQARTPLALVLMNRVRWHRLNWFRDCLQSIPVWVCFRIIEPSDSGATLAVALPEKSACKVDHCQPIFPA